LWDFRLILNYHLEQSNSDVCLDAIFALEHLTSLDLGWNGISLEDIRSSLVKQGAKKRLTRIFLSSINLIVDEAGILGVCEFLPDIVAWSSYGPRSTFSVAGIRAWKRICPRLVSVDMNGMSEEVEEELRALGIRF
jgi:hypothetical protein